MRTFKRDNDKNKRLYYQLFILIELSLLFGLYYLHLHWALLLLLTPVILLDAWSNLRCANRQKKFIKEIQIAAKGIECKLANGQTDKIPFKKALFSIREQKFEKEKTEIEIRVKRLLKSRLVGRMHIKHWTQIFEIKDELARLRYQQIKYRPEGYWSKYGTLTADIAITSAALALGELADISGNSVTASRAGGVLMPLHDLKETLNAPYEESEGKKTNKE